MKFHHLILYILKWLFIGWWAVPLLGLFLLLIVIFDTYGWLDHDRWDVESRILRFTFWTMDALAWFFLVPEEG